LCGLTTLTILYIVTANNKTVKIVSNNAEQTYVLGLNMGKNLKGGEVIQLVSDLGGGKTTFTKGIVKGLGSNENVSSPTFTVQKDYQAGKLTVHHFDFYRLNDPGVVGQELQEYFYSKRDIVLIEWGELVSGILPEQTIIVNIDYLGIDKREIAITSPHAYEYIVRDLT
jgi:tRNA threonylcarbamoyladenosine biosynthesis protein TsaE